MWLFSLCYNDSMITLIENAAIIPMTKSDYYFRGNIVIEDGKIRSTGNESAEADERIDASAMIALPSFVNAHTHLSMVLMRNYKDTCENLQDWLSEIFPIEDKLNDEDIYQASRLGAAELIESGCTVFADMYFHAWNTVKAIKEAGIRGIIGQTFMSDASDAEYRIEEIAPRILEAIGDDDSFRLDAAVHAVYTSTPDCYERAAAWAKERGVRMHTHLAETRKEVEDCIREYGKTPAALLDGIGIFSSVPTYVAHGVFSTENDMEILRRNNVSVVHNPASNMKLASGIAPVKQYREMGINVALGTDGASSNNNLSMIKEMNTAALLQTVANMTPSAARPYDIIAMATINGAKALGLDDRIGTIEEGKEADIVLINTDDSNMTPLNDPFSAVVFSADRKNIDTVFSKGRKLLEKGKLLTIDKEEAVRKTNERWEDILRR